MLPKFPTVRDHMDTRQQSLRQEMPILDAVEFLLEKHITGAPVVDGDNAVVGVLSEFDCLNLLTKGYDHAAPVGTVGDFMTPSAMTVQPKMDIYYAAGLFLNNIYRRFPVVEDGKLVGVITRFDLLRAISANISLAAPKVE